MQMGLEATGRVASANAQPSLLMHLFAFHELVDTLQCLYNGVLGNSMSG